MSSQANRNFGLVLAGGAAIGASVMLLRHLRTIVYGPLGIALFLFGCALLVTPLLLCIPRDRPRRLLFCMVYGLALIISVSFSTFAAYWHWRQSRPPFVGVRRSEVAPLFEKITRGLNKEQVVALLGEPREKLKETGKAPPAFGLPGWKPYQERWRYSRGWAFADIYFDAEGKVLSKFMDQ